MHSKIIKNIGIMYSNNSTVSTKIIALVQGIGVSNDRMINLRILNLLRFCFQSDKNINVSNNVMVNEIF